MIFLEGKIDRTWWPFLKRLFLWLHSGLKHFVHLETERYTLCQPAAEFWPAFYASEALDTTWTIQLRRPLYDQQQGIVFLKAGMYVGSDMKDADIPNSVSFPSM